MHILIVEDNFLVVESIKTSLTELGYSSFALASSYEEAIQSIEAGLPKIAILDIELKGEKTGLDVAAVLKSKNIPFIFLSDHQDMVAYQEVMSLKAPLLDKPFTKNNFRNAIGTAIANHSKNTEANEFYFLKDGDKRTKVILSDIIYIKAAHNYCDLYFAEGKRKVASLPMGTVLKNQFSNTDMVQIHRSYAVRLSAIKSISGNMVQMIDDSTHKIGDTFKTNFENKLKSL